MGSYILPSGIGGVLGDELTTTKELYLSDATLIFFVHSGTGSDTNAGNTRQKPFATLVHALSVVVDDCIIVLLDGHTETITATQTIPAAGIKIVGEGRDVQARPTVKLTGDVAGPIFNIGFTGVTIANIWFPPALQAPGQNAKIYAGQFGHHSKVRGCYFEVGDFESWFCIEYEASSIRHKCYDSTFVVVSTTNANVLGGVGYRENTDCELEGCTFDGGSLGFGFAIFDVTAIFPNVGLRRFRAERIRLLNGSVAQMGTPKGYMALSESTGNSGVLGFNKRLPKGFGQIGDVILESPEFYYTGQIRYVSSITGNDANQGLDEFAPCATIRHAAAIAGDDSSLIVALPGHVESLTDDNGSIIPTPSGVTIIGCGSSNGLPTVRVFISQTGEGTGFPLFDFTTQVSYLRNIHCDGAAPGAGGVDQSMILIQQNGSEVRGCLLTPGPLDSATCIECGATWVNIRDTKFEPTDGGRVPNAIEIDGDDLDLRGVEVSSGTSGWSASAINVASAVGRLYGIGITQSLGADVSIDSGATGVFNPETSSGSALVTW